MAKAPQKNQAALELDALRRGIVAELWQHPRYKHLIEKLSKMRPVVPYWKRTYVKDGVTYPDNTAELQAASAAQKHHDVLMRIMDPNTYRPEEV